MGKGSVKPPFPNRSRIFSRFSWWSFIPNFYRIQHKSKSRRLPRKAVNWQEFFPTIPTMVGKFYQPALILWDRRFFAAQKISKFYCSLRRCRKLAMQPRVELRFVDGGIFRFVNSPVGRAAGCSLVIGEQRFSLFIEWLLGLCCLGKRGWN